MEITEINSNDSWEEFWANDESVVLHPGFQSRDPADVVTADVLEKLKAHLFFKTSGSSGKPKWVALSKKAMLASAGAVNRHLGIQECDRWVNPLPLFHVGGMGIMARAYLSNSKVEMLDSRWNPEFYTEVLYNSQGQWTSLVPTQMVDLVRESLCPPESLKGVVIGGGVLEGDIKQHALDLGWPVLESYGMSEAGSQIATAVEAGGEMVLLDHVVIRCSNKLLEWKGESQFSGYVIDNKFIPQKGWVKTNDLVQVEDGKLSFIKRADRVVKVLGELVDVDELEREINAQSDQQVVLIVKSEERRGNVIIPVVEAEPSVALVELVETFTGIRKLEGLEIRPFSRSALGKIQRGTT